MTGEREVKHTHVWVKVDGCRWISQNEPVCRSPALCIWGYCKAGWGPADPDHWCSCVWTVTSPCLSALQWLLLWLFGVVSGVCTPGTRGCGHENVWSARTMWTACCSGAAPIAQQFWSGNKHFWLIPVWPEHTHCPELAWDCFSESTVGGGGKKKNNFSFLI